MSELVVREIQTDEIGYAANLVAEILAGNDRERNRAIYERYAKQLPNRPQGSNSCYRVAFRNKHLVSLIHTIDFSLRYGRAALKVVGVGLLCTHPEYRNRGYASAVLKDTLTFAAVTSSV
jgi:predicted acetyltransferase